MANNDEKSIRPMADNKKKSPSPIAFYHFLFIYFFFFFTSGQNILNCGKSYSFIGTVFKKCYGS